MRRRSAVALIAAAAAAPWFWFHPTLDLRDQPAQRVGAHPVPKVGDWVGGLSGLELTEDGRHFFAVTDKGHMARGTLERTADDTLTAVTITSDRMLVATTPADEELPRTDAEGLALDPYGRLLVSFEHDHRIIRIDTWDAPSITTSRWDAWEAFTLNGGLEALAIAPDGILYAIPENIASGATRAMVFTLSAGTDWQLSTTIPVDPEFSPVGADFGPDGLFYLLERGVYPFGFFSRVRRMSLTPQGAGTIETILETPLFRHGNLEGLAVWRDTAGHIRLTMVSDDNFLPFVRGEIVEYLLPNGVAQAVEAD